MKTIIISSSTSKESKSFILCQEVAEKLINQGIECSLIDARLLDLKSSHSAKTPSMIEAIKKINEADNLIIGMGVHNYSVNDSLKIMLDTCFDKVNGKFFGVLCAAGGEKSYLPRIIYATGKDFTENKVTSTVLKKWMSEFVAEYISIGKKLLN
jgi:NAD(P)H-dependent FMN reductase